MKRFWSDESGAVLSAEIVLLGSVLVIGAVSGLTAVRDSVDSELKDVATALSNVNQSYGYHGIRGCGSFTAGSLFVDVQDDRCGVVLCSRIDDRRFDRDDLRECHCRKQPDAVRPCDHPPFVKHRRPTRVQPD